MGLNVNKLSPDELIRLSGRAKTPEDAAAMLSALSGGKTNKVVAEPRQSASNGMRYFLMMVAGWFIGFIMGLGF